MNALHSRASIAPRFASSITASKSFLICGKHVGNSTSTSALSARLISFPNRSTEQVISMRRILLTNKRHFASKPWRVQNKPDNWYSKIPIFDGNNFIWGVIIANFGIFSMWSISENDRNMYSMMRKHFTVSSDGIVLGSRFHTLITSTFSHSNIFHLGSNMLTFYFVASNVQNVIGVRRIIPLYIGGCLASSISQVLWPYIIPKSFSRKYRVPTHASAMG